METNVELAKSINLVSTAKMFKDRFLKSREFHQLTHDQLNKFLKSDPYDIEEIQLFDAIIGWAKANCRATARKDENYEPTVDEIQILINPTGQENLLDQIRVPLFTNEQWRDLWDTEEAILLPLTVLQKKNFDEYFSSDLEDEKLELRARQALTTLNFLPRVQIENGEEEAWKHPVFLAFVSSEIGRLNKDFFNSNEFFNFSHADLLAFLKCQPSGVEEVDLFYAITNWAKKKCSPNGRAETPEPKFQEFRKIISPSGGENLMAQIRVPRFSKDGWNAISRTMEVNMLPLKLEENILFNEYFNADSKAEKEDIQKDLIDYFKLERQVTDPSNRASTSGSQSTAGLHSTAAGEVENIDLQQRANPPTPRGTKRLLNGGSKESARNSGKETPNTTAQTSPIEEQFEIFSSSESDKDSSSDDDPIVVTPSTSRTVRKTSSVLDQRRSQTHNHARSSLTSETEVTPRKRSKRNETTPSSSSETSDDEESIAFRANFKKVKEKFSDYFQTVDRQKKEIWAEFTVSDHIKGLDLDRINPKFYPKLIEFHLKFTFNEKKPDENKLDERFKKFVVETINLQQYLCFKIKDGRNSLKPRQLWDSNVNLSLEFHGCVIIKMNHQHQELILNTPKGSLEILKGLKKAKLKKLSLSCSELTMDLNFDQIETLTLYGVKGRTKFNDIMSKCKSLVELTLWKNENNLEPVDLSKINNPEKLQWLALCKSNVSMSRPIIFENLKTLHLNNSFLSNKFEKDFRIMFPNIKTLSISLENCKFNLSPKFLLSILVLPRLDFVRVLDFNWIQHKSQEKYSRDFQKVTGLNTKNTSFILKKHKGKWVATPLNEDDDIDVEGGYTDTVDEQEHEFYKLDTFFKKYSDTVPAWLTYAHFG